MNTKYILTKLVIITLLCSISMVLHAAHFEPADKNQPTAVSGTGALSISGTGGIATRAFTGVWNQPAHQSQATVIQMVSDGSGGLNAIVYWFGYDNLGNPYWFFAEGPVTDSRAELTIYKAANKKWDERLTSESTVTSKTKSKFAAPAGDNNNGLQVWGAGTIEFDNCTQGTFTGLNSISGTGGFKFPIEKIANIADTTCSGGTSDGLNPSDSPIDLKAFFTATTAGAGSSGKSEFEISAGRTDFSVEIEDLPIGEYGLSIDGINQGSIQVVANPSGGTRGALEFRSPVEPGKELLTFDPRDKLVDVTNSDSTIVLSQLFPLTTDTGSGPGTGTGLPGGDDLEIKIDLTNSGVFPAGDAKAKFEQRPVRSEFSVELENIPVGDYDLYVGGELKGSITVVDLVIGTEGEIEFRNPLEAGKLLLDFDPRDQVIEVKQQDSTSTLLFSVTFVASNATGSDGGNDDGSDDGSDNGSDDNGDSSIEVKIDLLNTGFDQNATGALKYYKVNNQTEIEVKIEGLSVDGDYDVVFTDSFVFNDSIVGVIVVEGGEGEWRFISPQDGSNDPFLDFIPFGATVSVRLNGIDVLLVNIP